MSKNNRERQAEFKQRMRDAGKKQITIWVTAKQEKTIRTILLADDVTDAPSASPPRGAGATDLADNPEH